MFIESLSSGILVQSRVNLPVWKLEMWDIRHPRFSSNSFTKVEPVAPLICVSLVFDKKYLLRALTTGIMICMPSPKQIRFLISWFLASSTLPVSGWALNVSKKGQEPSFERTQYFKNVIIKG